MSRKALQRLCVYESLSGSEYSWPVQEENNFHVYGMELNFYHFPENPVHVSGLSGQDTAPLMSQTKLRTNILTLCLDRTLHVTERGTGRWKTSHWSWILSTWCEWSFQLDWEPWESAGCYSHTVWRCSGASAILCEHLPGHRWLWSCIQGRKHSLLVCWMTAQPSIRTEAGVHSIPITIQSLW